MNSENTTVSLESIDYGRQRNNGGHDHRFNKGNDRTPAQKQADKEKKQRK